MDEKKAKTVRMVRDRSRGTPTEADVHQNEVENYKAGGFVLADSDEGKRIQAALKTKE